MKVTETDGAILVSGVKCFAPALTLDCGQAFRWREQADGSFSGVAGGHFLNIRRETDGTLVFRGTTRKVFEQFWVSYFDLHRDYEAICCRLKEDALLAETVDEYEGIRILRQEPWEALCSFVISQQNNIKRIKLIIDRLCSAYGDDLGNGFYTFPTAERLAALTEADFLAIGAGYRAKYLERLAKDVAGGVIDLEKIKALPLNEARQALLKLYGVGVKVADCALLFGFGFDSAFPQDVWMKRVMAFYPDGLPACFNGIEGIAQQYLFHWARKHL